MTMTTEMKIRLQKTLEKVVEPRSGVSILDLNIIEGIKYNELVNKFFIYINQKEASKTTGVVFNFLGENLIESSIDSALRDEFPEISARYYYL